MTRIGIILGSTRPGRRGEVVAKWVLEVASKRGDADFELIDLADYPLHTLTSPCHRRWVSIRTSTQRTGQRPSHNSTDSSS